MQSRGCGIPGHRTRALSYALAALLLGTGCTDDFSRFRFGAGQQRSQPVAGSAADQNMSTSTQSAEFPPQGLPSHDNSTTRDAGAFGTVEDGAIPAPATSGNTTNNDGYHQGANQPDEGDSDAGASTAGQATRRPVRTAGPQHIAGIGQFLRATRSCPIDFLSDAATNVRRGDEPFLIVTQVCRGSLFT